MMEYLQEVDAIAPAFIPVMVFIFGACLGSFFNVCIYRIPAGRSVVWPPSQSSSGEAIAWYDNIPILSWFILGGKSRHGKEPFSIRYPLVEALTALLFLACWLLLPPIQALGGMLLVSILVPSSFIDWDHRIIPDRFSVGGFAVGVLFSGIFPEIHGLSSASGWISAEGFLEGLVQGLLGSAIILWVGLTAEVALRKEAMGMGDVKLLGAVGAFCGWQGAVFALCGGAVAGSITFGLIALGKKIFPEKFSPQPTAPSTDGETDKQDDPGDMETMEVPFGPFLAMGAMAYFLWFQQDFDLHLETLRELMFWFFR